MKTLHVNIPGHEYDIVSEPGLLDQAGSLLRPILKGRMAAIVTDSNVEPLYAARLVVTPFSALHITAGVLHAAAIQTAFKQSPLSLIWVYGVVDHAVQRGLLLIGGILDGFLKTGTDGKNFGDCHIRTI